jgi:hypothetical protein
VGEPIEQGTSQSLRPKNFCPFLEVGLGDEGAMASLYDRHSTGLFRRAQGVSRFSLGRRGSPKCLHADVAGAPAVCFGIQEASMEGLGCYRGTSQSTLCARRKSSESSEEASLSRPFDPISHTEVSRLMQKPHALVLLLPDADRQVLEMAFFDGKTSVEIAEETGFPVDTIGRRLRDALSA